MKIKNNEELDQWLFHHAVILDNTLVAVKNEQGQNDHWVDTETGEKIKVVYEDE